MTADLSQFTHVLDCFITRIDGNSPGETAFGGELGPATADFQFEAQGPDRKFNFRGEITLPYDQCPSIATRITVALRFNAPIRVRIKRGWEDAGRCGSLVHTHQLDQFWSMVLWDGEEDPECFKTCSLEREDGGRL